MKKGTLPKKTLLLWQIRVVMLTALVVAVCFNFANLFPFLKIVAIVSAVTGILVAAFYLPLFVTGYRIYLKNDAVIINHGVFIKVTHIMPYSRLIYVQSFRTPLARLFSLSALSLKAARSKVFIPEMPCDDANRFISSVSSDGGV